MRRTVPLPATLPRAFATSVASEHGVAPRRLRARDVQHPFHGVNAIGDVSAVEAYRHRMLPGQFFSHHTAAIVHGIPLPRTGRAVHVAVVAPRTPPRASGVVGHRVSADVEVVTLPDGTPVCSAADTWCQLAVALSTSDLVAAADHLLGARGRPAIASVDELDLAARRHARGRGARARRDAMARARWGSDSRPESLLRLLVEDLEVGDVLINHPLTVGGRTLHPDLLVPSRSLILEYEGDHHRVERDQWNHDLARYDAFAAAGWRVMRVTSRQLFDDPEGLARRVRNVRQTT
ncbi:endonuclease domain-containing protein [Leifsonia poae]|uniref:DUF559 domain-containing protein n=1 Tax=Leifsonia poae TaxID=110933 RepID=A0A9W6HBE4_9MICO|nr:hypothetical protein [Leifsonia poae]GLJ77436.1 hypothetical protein GCM10017584_30100 [Leifsonia poae]